VTKTFSDLSELLSGSRCMHVMPHCRHRCARMRPMFSAAATSVALDKQF